MGKKKRGQRVESAQSIGYLHRNAIDCMLSGDHGKSRDDDGYCNACGFGHEHADDLELVKNIKIAQGIVQVHEDALAPHIGKDDVYNLAKFVCRIERADMKPE